MPTPITIRHLTKRFGATTAVDDVSLDIPAGALFFLLGPSGCGKTTLLRMLAGFTDPTAGSIAFGTRDVTHVPPNQRHTGMVFQSYALWPHMTVAQNVAFGLSVRKVPGAQQKRRVEAALAQVQMLPYAQRKPNELSGGQQQRVALARALVIEPTVLLLDEPLSNLDAKLRLDMRGQIRQVCKDAQITAVYVTHDQKEALSMADSMAVLKDGKVVQVGGPRALYDRPGSRFVADFLGETNFVPATVVGREGDAVVLECPAGKFRSCASSGNGAPGTAPGSAPGGSVVCSLRPESIRVLRSGETAPAGANLFAARALDAVYLGEMAQHQLLLPGDVKLKAFELNPRPLGEGDATVRVAFDPQDVVVLRE
jgi:iron(III) transport system ATP-binding protein